MNRRDAVELIVFESAAPLGAQQAPAQAGAEAHQPRFFSPEQLSLVDALSEMIIPADSHSGGAHEAGVVAFINEYVAAANADVQKAWTAGLAAVDAEARKRHGKEFAGCGQAERDAILAEMAEGESSPETELHRFFVRIKAQTISGYYTSSVGLLRDLHVQRRRSSGCVSTVRASRTSEGGPLM